MLFHFYGLEQLVERTTHIDGNVGMQEVNMSNILLLPKGTFFFFFTSSTGELPVKSCGYSLVRLYI